jgi:nucleoside-diphosphate-sugar epimerase
MTKLVFGCGYLGERVARRWREAGHEVVVVTRSAGRAATFDQLGYESIIADITQPATLRNLPVAETVLFAVGFDRTSGQAIDDVYAGGMRNVLASLPADTGTFIYISTTGVYGPAGGDWVDESTPADPRREGGVASREAELALGEHSLGRRGFILRLAGIYGPGRVPFLRELQAGEPISAPTKGYLNLIHVDDAAAVVEAAAIRSTQLKNSESFPRVYCVSDGQPVERGKFYRAVARRINAPAPRFIEPDPGSSRAARARSNRRICNKAMIADLGVELTYPDYQAGLAAILESKNQQAYDG